MAEKYTQKLYRPAQSYVTTPLKSISTGGRSPLNPWKVQTETGERLLKSDRFFGPFCTNKSFRVGIK